MSGELVELLKRRAEVFLNLAQELLEKDVLDIAAFCVEQACQLRVKATLLRLFAEYPRLHTVRDLLGLLARKLREIGREDLAERVMHFARCYRDLLLAIEDAYIRSRYGVFIIPREEVEKMLSIVKTLFDLLENIERDVLG